MWQLPAYLVVGGQGHSAYWTLKLKACICQASDKQMTIRTLYSTLTFNVVTYSKDMPKNLLFRPNLNSDSHYKNISCEIDLLHNLN